MLITLPSSLVRCRYIAAIAAFLTLICAAAATAHPIQMEPVIVNIHPQKTFLSVEFSGAEQTLMTGVSINASDRKPDGSFGSAVESKAEAYINNGFKMSIAGVPLTGKLTGLDADGGADLIRAHFHLVMRYERSGAALKTATMTVHTDAFTNVPLNKTIITVGAFSKTLDHADTVVIDPSNLAVNLLRNIRDFMWMGINHIFTGPDHMLFILGLLVASTGLRPLIKTLTGFTIAHSITLALSALNVVVLNGRICDILIALSIIYIGVENMFKVSATHRFWIASAFGLVHGFGFSDTLRDIGLPHDSIGWCLMSFNGGVEIAQIIICSLAFPLLMLWKKDIAKRAQYGGMNWPMVIRVTSVWVVLMGGYWLVERAMG